MYFYSNYSMYHSAHLFVVCLLLSEGTIDLETEHFTMHIYTACRKYIRRGAKFLIKLADKLSFASVSKTNHDSCNHCIQMQRIPIDLTADQLKAILWHILQASELTKNYMCFTEILVKYCLTLYCD